MRSSRLALTLAAISWPVLTHVAPARAQEAADASAPEPPATAPAEEPRRAPSTDPSVVEEPRPPMAPSGGVPLDPGASTAAPAPAQAPSGDWPARLAMQGRDPAYFRRFEALREPGLSVSYPPIIDTVTGDLGGWRTKLADLHTLVELRDTTSLTGNVLDAGQPRDPQRYNGQRFTALSQLIGTATIGLDGIGLPNSKIVAGFNALYVNFRNLGPSTFVVRDLYYYQSWDKKAVEFKIGLFVDYFEYVGFFTGGQPILSTGLSGLIPIANGLSGDPYPTPAANLTFNADSGLYVKFGLERSVSPAGSIYEVTNTHLGFKFSQPGAGPLMLGEAGIKRPPKPGEHQLWVRGGGLYNDSDYPRFDGPGKAPGVSLWGLADYQLVQTERGRPFRGIYAGVSGFYGDPKTSVFTQTYEGRVYAIGPLDLRPADAIAVRVAYSRFSEDAYRAYSSRTFVNGDQFSVIGSYTVHALPGIYVIPNISYLTNPSFVGQFKNALVLGTTFSVLL